MCVCVCVCVCVGFPGSTVVKNPLANVGDTRDMGSNPGWGRAPGVGNGNPLQYSCLENSTDRGTWWTIVHGIARNWTLLSMSTNEHERKCVNPNLLIHLTSLSPLCIHTKDRVCFLHLYLYFCFANRFICTIFSRFHIITFNTIFE